MPITLIAATGLNREIGCNNKLLWHIPEDLQYFKSITINQHIVMGRLTYESIGRALPNRFNYVMSNNPINESGVQHISYEGVIELAKDKEVFIIGGQSIYELFMPIADRLILTIIPNKYPEADRFFPKLDDWEEYKLDHLTGSIYVSYYTKLCKEISNLPFGDCIMSQLENYNDFNEIKELTYTDLKEFLNKDK